MPADDDGVVRTLRGYFTHTPGQRVRMQNATRYLCCAAYRDEALSKEIIKEFLYDQHRAVVPSYGFDLRPVLAHCLHAREMRLVRDTMITAAIVVGLVLSWQVTLLVLGTLTLLAAALAVLPKRAGRFQTAVTIALPVAGGPLLLYIGTTMLKATSEPGLEAGGDGFAEPVRHDHWFIGGLGLFALLLGISFVHRLAVVWLLRSLGPDAPVAVPRVRSQARSDRIDRVGAAQYGNVTLYSRQNPFVGSGKVDDKRTRVWSLVIELDRVRPARADRPALAVDPVDMRAAIERRLTAMRDDLPPDESVDLLVNDHVVAEGECVQGRRPFGPAHPGVRYEGHPLIDPNTWRPFSKASQAAVEVLVRNPQADLRCYQRITVEAHAASVTDDGRWHVVPARDEGVQITGFLYLAVQGRMLYAQFVCNALPPIRKDFKLVDVLPSFTPAEVVLEALRQGGAAAVGEAVAGPLRLVAAVPWAEIFQQGAERHRRRFFAFDYGARMSVRERAAEPAFTTFLQELDVNKHTRLIERRVMGALLDHLQHDRNIDVSDYRTETASIISNSLIMNGGTVNGQLGFAPGGDVRQEAAG
ncbi:hypothetical protein ABZ914_28295 [Spirillospora sp. NPDC046719]